MPGVERGGIRAMPWAITGTWFLVVLSVVSWRPDALFDGGFDAVVVAKAVIAVTALGCALLIHHRSTTRARVGVRSVILLIVVVGLSMLGALATGDVAPSLILAVRLLLVAATVYVLASSDSAPRVLTGLFVAMGALALVGAVSGIPTLIAEGRLATGIPAMRPNELAGLAAPPLLALVVGVARRGLSLPSALLIVAFGSIVWATGSRTTLLVLGVAIVVGIVLAWPVPHSTGIGLILLLPVSYALIAFTDVVSEAVIRGQDIDQLTTLSSRTIAWDAVLGIPFDTWLKWIGTGLAVKTVEVNQRWWDVQVLDSSWISILAQAGILGLIAVGVWVLFALRDSLRASGELRVIALPLLLLLLLRSGLENGLIESSAIFILFLLTSIVLERGYRFPFVPDRSIPYALALPDPNPARYPSPTPTRTR
jgi:hypothetical protein